MDLLTRDGALAWAEEDVKVVGDYFLKKGHWNPFAVMIATRDPDGKETPNPHIVPVMSERAPRNSREKDAFADALRAMIRQYGAVGIAFSSEVWFAPYGKKGDLPSKRPDRREAIYYSFEHIRFEKPFVRVGLISRDPLALDWRTPEQAFNAPEGIGPMGGRFGDLLDRTRIS